MSLPLSMSAHTAMLHRKVAGISAAEHMFASLSFVAVQGKPGQEELKTQLDNMAALNVSPRCAGETRQ